jgi:hypothetical protein
MSKIAYRTKRGEYAREYIADVANLHINLDKCSPEYLGWCIFIVEFDGPNHVESDMTKVVYHTYSQTLKEAKELAQAFVDGHLILQRAV